MTRAIALHARHRLPAGGVPDDHGHLYRIEVTVRATIDAARPMVADLAALDRILTDELAEPLSGRHLNEAVPEFVSGQRPASCEAFAAWCWQKIGPRLPAGVELERVRVAEDPTLWADCTGVC